MRPPVASWKVTIRCFQIVPRLNCCTSTPAIALGELKKNGSTMPTRAAPSHAASKPTATTIRRAWRRRFASRGLTNFGGSQSIRARDLLVELLPQRVRQLDKRGINLDVE